MILDYLNNRRWSTWTNFFLFIPVIISVFTGNLYLAILIFLLTIFSFLYHFKKPQGVDWWWSKKSLLQHSLLFLDTAIGLVVGFYIVSVLFSVGLDLKSILISFLLILSTICLFVVNKYYEAFHGIWHILISITISLFVLFFK